MKAQSGYENVHRVINGILFQKKQFKGKSTLLPVSSIVKDNAGNSYVYIKDATTGKPVKKQIKTAEIKGTEVEVIGLSTTEQVVEVKESTTKKDDPSLMGAPMGGEGGPPPGGGGGPR